MKRFITLVFAAVGLFVASASLTIAQAQTATTFGKIVDAETGDGMALVNVVVLGTNLGVASNDKGDFRITNLAAGKYSLRFSAVGYRALTMDVILLDGKERSMGIIEMEIWSLRMDEIVVSPGRFTIMGVDGASKQTLSEDNLRNMSWAEDITRAVTRLPGISSTDFSSKFTIRGGEANEVMISLDGMELYEPFHQRDKAGGLFSIVDIEAIRGVDLMTGGYSAAYGNRMSGVFDMQSRNVQAGERRTSVGLSMMNARVYTQGSFSHGKGSYLASVRRGMLDFTFKLVPNAEVVPKFHDALLKVDYQLSSKHKASFHVLEAGDKTSIDDADNQGNFDKNRTEYLNLYGWATLTSVFTPQLTSRTIAYSGLINHDRMGSFHKYEPTDKGDFFVRDKRDYSFIGVKQDWNWVPSEKLALSAGFETKQVAATYDYTIDQDELRVDPTGGLYDYVRSEQVHLAPTGNQSSAYLSARIKVAGRIAIEPGLRVDHTSYTSDNLVSPRIGVVYALSDRTFLRVATGFYYQSDFINEINVNNGRTNFNQAQLAKHYVVGLQHQTENGIDIRLEAYHKDMSHLSPNWTTLRDQQEMFPEQRNDNALLILNGARADGIELFVKQDLGGKISWWFSYALARAQDNIKDIVFDAPLEKQTGWVARPNNQRHTIYADLNYKLGQKWRLNFSFKYYNGWPRTDYTFQYLTLDNGDLHFYPVEKKFNGTQYPAYHRFDVRINRQFTVKHGTINTFLQIINVYNRQNLRKFDLDTRNDADEYSLDEQGNYVPFEDHVYWFGLIPVIGASWSF